MSIKGGWGNYPILNCNTFSASNINKIKHILLQNKKIISYGNGRSYGDSALNENIILTKSLNKIFNFDKKKGTLHCQSGVLLKAIIEKYVPKGWFLHVSPGTKMVTIGGAIASDIHGKNHHIDGCFSNFVEEFKIILPNGNLKTCSSTRNKQLFRATCGGMGLTGIIIEAKIKLKKINSKNLIQTTIKTENLKETFEEFEKNSLKTYSVAWLDTSAKMCNIGRSHLMIGEFCKDGNLSYNKKKKISVPFYFPHIALNYYTIKLFNWLYYNKRFKKISKTKVDIDQFFYPLDNIKNWNRLYGKKGFIQYQFILPKKLSYRGIYEILKVINLSKKNSFLAVLKLHGKKNKNYLSFPIEGYSLAIDFKIQKDLFSLLTKLDKIVLKYKGKIYLTKDARIVKDVFDAGYPLISKFRKYRQKNNMQKKFESYQSKRLDL